MEPLPRPSFIPKQVLTSTPEKLVKKNRFTADLFMVLAVVTLTVAVLFHGAVYFYKFLLEQKINAPCEETAAGDGTVSRCGLRASVEKEERALNRETVLQLQRLDQKLKLAAELSRTHTTFLPVFYLFENLTLPSIAYTRFSFNGGVIIAEGQATRYEDIALQGDVFHQSKERVRDFSFSNLNLDKSGNVVFTLRLVIEPGILTYSPS